MKKLIFFVLVLAFSAAQSSEIKIYSFGGLRVAFLRVDGFMVNKGCLEKPCLALERAKEFKGESVDPDLLEGGKNPKAVKCKSLLKGKVIIGLDLHGNEQSFCHFPDDSFLR